MTKARTIGIGAVAATMAFAAISIGHAADPAVTCEAAKLKEAGKYANCRMKADSKAAKKNEAPDYTRCESKFSDKWGKAEAKAAGACPSNGDETAVESAVTACMGDIAAGLAPAAPCSGVEVGGACWFLGAGSDDCDTTCVGAGLAYDEATRTYAGSDGTDGQCEAVFDALGVAPSVLNVGPCGGDDLALGCVEDQFGGGSQRIRCSSPSTNSSAFSTDARRACACQ